MDQTTYENIRGIRPGNQSGFLKNMYNVLRGRPTDSKSTRDQAHIYIRYRRRRSSMGTDTPPPSHVLISSWVSSQQSPRSRAHHHHNRLCEERAHDLRIVMGVSERPTSPLTRTLSRVSRLDQRRVEFSHLKVLPF